MWDRFVCIFGNVYLAYLIVHVAFLALWFPLAKAVGLHPCALQLFSWRVFGFQIGQIRVGIGWIPLGSAVTYRKGELERLRPVQIIGFQLVVLLPMLVAAVLSREFGQNSRTFIDAFSTVLAGIFEPFDSARSVAAFYSWAGGTISWNSLGLLISCVLPFNVLEIVLTAPALLIYDRPDDDRLKKTFLNCTLLLFVMYACWVVGTLAFIFGG